MEMLTIQRGSELPAAAPQIQNSSASAVDYIHARGETEEFMALSHKPRPNKPSQHEVVRLHIEAMLKIDALIAAGRGKVAARREVAELYLGTPGLSLTALNTKHSVWLHGGFRGGQYFQRGDWRYFIDQYNNGEVAPMLRNVPFCEYLAMLVGDTQRKDIGRAVRRRLLEQWQAGKTIPGVGTIAEWCARQKPPRPVPSPHRQLRSADYPRGWSEWQLARCVASVLGATDSAKRLYLQRGEEAAQSHWADQLYRSRANLRPLELITCDDVEFDIYVWMPLGDGTVQIVRPRGLFIMDVATATILNFGVAGAYTRRYYGDGGDADTRRSIQTTDMKDLFLATLDMYGLPQNWPMHFLHENATAKLSEHDMAIFAKWLPIKFASTQMMKTKLPGGFMESCGNPKQKGWIESFFRLFHTSTNHLPGTIGRRYDLTRGDSGVALWSNGKQRADRRDTRVGEAISIIRQAGELAAQRGCEIADLLDDGSGDAARLKLPVLKIDQFIELVNLYIQKLNTRTEHSLEGFEQIVDIEIRPGEYIPDYHPAAQQAARPGMRSRLRMEAPIERFQRLTQGQPFRKPAPHEMLVLARDTRPATIAAGQLSVKNQRYGTGIMHFRDAESAAALDAWNGKKEALIYFLSPTGDQAHLFTNDDAMQWVASPRRVGLPDIMDEKAMGKRMGEVHRGRETIRQEAAEIMAPRTAEIDAMRAHNAAILGSDAAGRTARVITQQEAAARTQRQADSRRRKAAAKVTDADIDSLLTADCRGEADPSGDPADPADIF